MIFLFGPSTLTSFHRKRQRSRNGVVSEGMAALVHGIVVAGPIVAASLSVARFVASERALRVLTDPDAEHSLTNLCDCGKAMETLERDLPATDGAEFVPTALDIPRDGENLQELADVSEVVKILLDFGLDSGHGGI